MATSAVLPAPTGSFTDVGSMLASVPADLFSSAADVPTPATEGVMDDAPVDEPTPEADEPASDDAAIADEPAETAHESIDAVPTDGSEPVEDGIVKSKDGKGKYRYQLDEGRYKTVYGNHQLVRQATDAIGEPLTLDGIKLRNEALQAQERMYDHLTSGEPQRQADVVRFMINEMKDAHADGETGVDPTVPFAETVYAALREQAPEAYDALRLQAAKDFLSEMYTAAASDEDNGLAGSAQRFSAKLAGIGPKPADMTDAQYAGLIRERAAASNIPFHTLQEMKGFTRGEDPFEAMRRENADLKARLDGRTQVGSAEQYSQWDKANVQAVNAAVETEAVLPALASVEEKWKKFPDDYKRLVVDPLLRDVSKIVRADTGLSQQIKGLRDRAQRATSESVRQQLGDQIRQLYVNRAKIAAESASRPILKFAADTLEGRSVQTNERHKAAQNRTAPNGSGSPVRQSVIPTEIAGFKNGVYDSGTAMKQALAVLAGR